VLDGAGRGNELVQVTSPPAFGVDRDPIRRGLSSCCPITWAQRRRRSASALIAVSRQSSTVAREAGDQIQVLGAP
jgi:hypothetical protein